MSIKNNIKTMTKISHISLIPAFILAAFLLLSVFAALPVRAQAVAVEECTLTKDIKAKTAAGADVTIAKGSVITAGDEELDTDGGAYKQWGLICLINTVNVVVDWIFIALLIVAVALFAIAGFMWMTAGGNAERQGQAGKMIIAAVIGIIIAILARVIPGIITGILL